MEFSSQEYWSGLLCPPPRDLPNPGTEPRSPTLQADSLLIDRATILESHKLSKLNFFKMRIVVNLYLLSLTRFL